MKDTAWWIAGLHPDWGGELARFFQEHLTARNLTAAERDDLQQKLVQFGESSAIQELLAATVERAASPEERVTAFRAMARTRAKELPSVWIAPLVRALAGRDPEVTRHAVAVVRAAPPSNAATAELNAALLRVARDNAAALGVRLDALAAIRGGLAPVGPDEFALLLASLEPAQPASIRAAAAGVIEKAKLDREQLFTLAERLEKTGPMELPRLLPAFDNAGDEALGLKMIAGLYALDRPIERARRQPASSTREVPGAGAEAGRGAAGVAQRGLREADAASRGASRIARGRRHPPRPGGLQRPEDGVHVVPRHRLPGRENRPDLTRIGQIRSERDLLEAIVYPNASFARSYEPVIVSTTSGATLSGVVRSDRPDEMVLATSAGEERRIPRQDIDEVTLGTISIMPSGLAEQLTRQELADLLAFLKGHAGSGAQ